MKNGEPMIGVSIVVQGTKTETITDINGNFSLDVPTGRELVISYIGYKTQTVTATGSGTINVKMTPNTQDLDEVVIIGYGTVKKCDLTGAVVSMKNEDVTIAPTIDVMEALQGKISGMDIVKSQRTSR